jgi:CheY-like chemotaxis protein
MHASTGAPIRLDGLHVLAVDDDADIRDLVQLILETAGAMVTSAASAREAFEVLRRERPAVLLSDISMPDEDGFWLIAQVRELAPAHGGQTPAGALTSLTRAEDRARILRAGFQIHIVKPVDPAQLVAVVALLAIKE